MMTIAVARTARRARGRRLTLTRSSCGPRAPADVPFLLRPGFARFVRPVPGDQLSVLHVPAVVVAGLPRVSELIVRGLVLPRLHLVVRLPFADDEPASVDHRAAVMSPYIAGLLLGQLVHRFHV